MCGITGFFIKNHGLHGDVRTVSHEKLDFFLDQLLLGIEPRGKDATGVVSARVGSRTAYLEKADTDATNFIKWRRSIVKKPRFVLAHTRAWTKGSPMNLDNDHPVISGDYYVTHNGHVNNDDALFKEHELPRHAEVDSEVISALFSKFGMDQAHRALQVLDGNVAVAVCAPRAHPDTVLLAKGRMSPLVVLETRDVVVWASTRKAIEDAYKKVFNFVPKTKHFKELGFGKILLLSENKIERLSFKPYERPPYVAPKSSYSGGQGPYDWRSVNMLKWNIECECDHIQFHHTGFKYDGGCTMKDCRCHKFTRKIPDKVKELVLQEWENAGERVDEAFQRHFTVISDNGKTHTKWYECFSCKSPFSENEMDEIYGYWICESCMKEDDDGDDDPPKTHVHQLALPAGGSEDEPNSLVLDGAIDVEDDEDIENDPTVLQASEELGIKPAFLVWLLFEADEDVLCEDTVMLSAYIEADEVFSKCLRESAPNLTTVKPVIQHGDEDVGADCGVQVFDGEEEPPDEVAV